MSGLRVIAGKARGRRLRSVPGDFTRPITDRVKESLFNIIGGDIINSSLLDLFAGTGSVGIEALSRGAGFVRFIDINRKAVETIQINLTSTKLLADSDHAVVEVIQSDAFSHLNRIADRSFDYVYVAPPQYKEMWSDAIKILDENPNWLGSDGWVIAQIHPREYSKLQLASFSEFDQRKYGSTLLIFYEVKI